VSTMIERLQCGIALSVAGNYGFGQLPSLEHAIDLDPGMVRAYKELGRVYDPYRRKRKCTAQDCSLCPLVFLIREFKRFGPEPVRPNATDHGPDCIWNALCAQGGRLMKAANQFEKDVPHLPGIDAQLIRKLVCPLCRCER